MISRWDYIKIDPPPEVHLHARSQYWITKLALCQAQVPLWDDEITAAEMLICVLLYAVYLLQKAREN